MAEFHETRAGRTFYERSVPEIARHLGRIADALERIAANTTAASAGGEDPRDADVDEPLTERS